MLHGSSRLKARVVALVLAAGVSGSMFSAIPSAFAAGGDLGQVGCARDMQPTAPDVSSTCTLVTPGGPTEHITFSGTYASPNASTASPSAPSPTQYGSNVVENNEGSFVVIDRLSFAYNGEVVYENTYSNSQSGAVSVYWKGCSPSYAENNAISCGSDYFFYDPESDYWFCQDQRIYAYPSGNSTTIVYSERVAPDPHNGASCTS